MSSDSSQFSSFCTSVFLIFHISFPHSSPCLSSSSVCPGWRVFLQSLGLLCACKEPLRTSYIKKVLKEIMNGYTSKSLELALEMTLGIHIFVCEKAELVFWLGSVQHCKDRKKRSQELFVFAVINTDELSVWKCCKNGETWSKAREMHMQGGEKNLRQSVPSSGGSPEEWIEPDCCFSP